MLRQESCESEINPRKDEMYERDWLKEKASETQRPDVWKAYKTKKLTVNKKVKKDKEGLLPTSNRRSLW